MSQFDYSIHYSRFHSDSEAHAEAMATSLSKFLLSPHVPDDRNTAVLDIGCGYGFALRGMRKLGFDRVTGLELSQPQADRCRQAGFDVVVTGNTIEWLRSSSQKFGFIILLDVLEHFPVSEQIELMKAIYGSLCDGGKVLLTVPNANAILSARWRYIDYTHHSSFTEHSLFFVLRNAGFEIISLDSSKGLGAFPRRIWRRKNWPLIRKWLVRWCWLQVFKAEIPAEELGEVSFELNLKGVAVKQPS
jgi:SAM-dependent methyltransferase